MENEKYKTETNRAKLIIVMELNCTGQMTHAILSLSPRNIFDSFWKSRISEGGYAQVIISLLELPEKQSFSVEIQKWVKYYLWKRFSNI